nr:uncharacterized protein LOC117280321 [Nicotiana tomentosiformis]
MEESKPVQEMMTRFIIITNKLKSLGKVLTSEELVSKVLRILPASWESKVTAIQEAKELDKISLDELVGNLKTHEMRKIELRKKEPKRDKALVLKGSEEDESDSNDPNLAKVAKFMKNSKNASKRENNGKHKQIDKATYDGSYKYSKLYHRAFVAAYEDNRSDKEESKEDEAKSLYDVIDAHETVETEPPLKLGMHIGRPSLFDGHHYDEWKMLMDQSYLPKWTVKVTFCNKTKEEYDDEDRQLIQKNAKAKNLLYRSLPRNILYKVSSCISTHDIWRTLEADFGDENIEVALMAIEESQTDEEVIRMMAMSDSETEDETNQVKDLKNQVLELTSKNEKSSDTHCKGKMSDLQDNLEKELKRAKDNLCDVGSRNKILQKTSRKREYNQEEGIDYVVTFAPVSRMEAIRMLIICVAHMVFTLYQIDVESAFLNGYLKEEVFVKQPPRFESEEFSDYVFKLDKALYGLKHVPIICLIDLDTAKGVSEKVLDQYQLSTRRSGNLQATLVLMVLAKMLRALSACARGYDFFKGYNLLLQIWDTEHFFQREATIDYFVDITKMIHSHNERMRHWVSPYG